MLRRQLVTALVATAAMLGGAPTAVASSSGEEEIAASTAAARKCGNVRAGGYKHSRIRKERVSCAKVRGRLKKWAGNLPNKPYGRWFCWKLKRLDARTSRFACSRGNNNAPTFRFDRRRVS